MCQLPLPPRPVLSHRCRSLPSLHVTRCTSFLTPISESRVEDLCLPLVSLLVHTFLMLAGVQELLPPSQIPLAFLTFPFSAPLPDKDPTFSFLLLWTVVDIPWA